MNALTLLNNFEREFAHPFFRNSWLRDFDAAPTHNTLSSQMTYNEEKAAWVLTVELAGVTKENLKIDTLDGYLQISGEKTKGLTQGKFEGRYHLPENVNLDKVEAAFEDGILSVEIPLLAKQPAKTITIK